MGGPIENRGKTVVGYWQACYQSQHCVVSPGPTKTVAGALSLAAGVVGVLATGPVGAAIDIFGLVSGAISLDPPSPSYKHVSKPVKLPKVHLHAGNGLSARAANALTLTSNSSIETSTAGKAFLDAYQRYQGAVSAGSTEWMGRQVTATLRYGRVFAARVRHSAAVLTSQRGTLLRSPLGRRRVSANKLAKDLQAARRRGFSREVMTQLHRLGLSNATIHNYLNRLPTRRPRATTALAPILSPAFAKELLGFATGLEQYLAKLEKNHSPEHRSTHGRRRHLTVSPFYPAEPFTVTYSRSRYSGWA